MSTGTLERPRLSCDSLVVRQAKARTKEHLRDGGDLIAVLRDPPQSLRLDEALLCVPRFGEYNLERLCRSADLYPRWRLSRMTERQLGRLVRALREAGIV